MVNVLLIVIQLVVTLVVGLYFYKQLKQQKNAQPAARRESNREMEKLNRMRAVRLSEPLAEKVRPSHFREIVGQEDGIKSLKAILCGANPQHCMSHCFHAACRAEERQKGSFLRPNVHKRLLAK